MKHKVVSIRDKIADVYMLPSYFPNIGSATRTFGDAINDKESSLHKHPTHYDLFLLGEWDDNSGEYEPIDPPRQLAVGEEQVNK